MTDKLWYTKINEEDAYISKTLQEYIDVYFFDSAEFKAVEDITLENLGEFLEVMLKHYQQYHFHLGALYDTGEILENISIMFLWMMKNIYIILNILKRV
nr:hypothetical protein [Rickettsia sp. Tenjiku01]